MTDNSLSVFRGQPSWRLASDDAELHLTRTGGQLGGVRLRLGERWVEPLSTAPWADEPNVPGPAVERVLRGDFFCMPFGGGELAYKGELHPAHGETAGCDWTLDAQDDDARSERSIQLSMQTTVRPMRVRKIIALQKDHPVIYQRHLISGASGPMCLGHHAMLRFASPGRVAMSKWVRGQVAPVQIEDPARGGYQCLKVGAMFDRLDQVPMADGEMADLTHYPAREGFEDLVQVFADPALSFGWTVVSFAREGYLWYAIKDPQMLSGTVMWHSNGGRHYAPWNGRHRAVLGLEETTSYFHLGLEASAEANPANLAGLKTCVELDPHQPLVVNYIFGVARIPANFGAVRSVEQLDGAARFEDGCQSVTVPLDWQWLKGQ